MSRQAIRDAAVLGILAALIGCGFYLFSHHGELLR